MALTLREESGQEVVLPVMLGDLVTSPGPVGQGESVRLFVRNDDEALMRDVTVEVEGAGANHVELATTGLRNWGAGPLALGDLAPEEEVTFWCRAQFKASEIEGVLPFDFTVKATRIL